MIGLFLIYFLVDPRDGSVCYVGQTRRGMKRLKDHLRAAEFESKMPKLYNWMRSLAKVGLQPEFRVVEYLDSIEQLDDAEIYWGELCLSLGCPLKNVAPFGSNGKWFLTDGHRRSISEDRMGTKHHFYGKTHKPSTIEKMKRAHAGRTWTPEQIEKRAAKKRKPFVCVETGERFDCVRDFIARGHGTSRIKDVLAGHAETYHGLHYRRI